MLPPITFIHRRHKNNSDSASDRAVTMGSYKKICCAVLAGTGKTLVARALVHELSKGTQKVTFYSRSGSDILSKWFGESESNLRDLFEAVS